MTMTVTTTAQVDLAEVRKQLAGRQVDASVRDTVSTQQERLKRLETQLEAMQRQQGGHSFGHVPNSPPIDISEEDLQMLHTQAAQGDALGQFGLGRLYDFGRGVPQDYVKARQWYERAAAQRNGMAQSNLGLMYAYGYGVPQDYAKARQWFEKAAAQGDASAQNELGLLYSRGHGVPQDYTKARQWYEKAAAHGLTEAQNELGLMHVNGRGVPQDDVQAYMWWSLAAGHSTDNDQKLAAGYRDVIARSMTPAQIAEAKRLTSQCQTRQFKGCQ